ncbi:MAG: AEC family transporter [Christensenellales bacterium]
MDTRAVVLQILMLLLLIVIGAFLRSRKVMTDPVIKGVNQLLMQAAWPAMIIMTTQKAFSREMLTGYFRVALLGIAMLAGFSLLIYGVLVRRLPHERRTVFTALSTLPNIGFVGIPLIQAAYGDLGVLYLSGYMLAFNIVVFGLYHALFSGGKKLHLKVFLNGGLISCLLAAVFLLMSIKIPDPFSSLFNQLGGMTTPLSMLLLGARLKDSLHRERLADKLMWTAVVTRLLLFPLGAFLLLKLLGFGGMELSVLVTGSALPAASATQIFAEQYDKDYALAAQGVSISLLLCIFTIPLLLSLLGL